MIENKIAKSGLITIDLEKAGLPRRTDFVEFDLSEFLFRGLLLREKEFRQAMKNVDWSAFAKKSVAVFCSTDAIVPMWAYMLVGSYLHDFADSYVYGTGEELYRAELHRSVVDYLETLAVDDERVIVKGCGREPVPAGAYLAATAYLRPRVKSLFFGEACSTVPVFKQKKSSVRS